MFASLGRIVVRHPWRVIGLWLVAAIAIVALAPKLATTASEVSFLPSHYQSVQASDLQKKAFPEAATPAALVVAQRRDGRPLTAGDVSLLDHAQRVLAARHLPAVGLVDPAIVSSNHLVGVIGVQMPNAQGQLTKTQTDTILTLRRDITSLTKGTDLRAGVTGSAGTSSATEPPGATATVAVWLLVVRPLLPSRRAAACTTTWRSATLPSSATTTVTESRCVGGSTAVPAGAPGAGGTGDGVSATAWVSSASRWTGARCAEPASAVTMAWAPASCHVRGCTTQRDSGSAACPGATRSTRRAAA